MLCTTEEVQFHLQHLNTTKASGPDHISAQMLKGTEIAIAQIVTKLFNDSIQSGCFPVLWKSSNIHAIPKSNEDLTSPNNYRPISMLPVLSKILEKHVYSLLI